MVNTNGYKPKKVLITQNALRNIQGSEVVCLELAQFFKSTGIVVKVFTWYSDKPMVTFFKKSGIEVITNDEDEFFEECDLVWVQHQVLPQRLIRRISHIDQKHPAPIFIFFHMSFMKDLHLEQPYIYRLEQKIASKVLFVSPETRDVLTDLHCIDSIKCPKEIFPNPAPQNFSNHQESIDSSTTTPPQPSKILIVSNHIPPEITEAQKLLTKQGIEVKTIGECSKECTLITPDIINKYDSIVTIGKTVQYCLISGKPVYVYDHFGGPGYLNEQNFASAAYHNFSGRGFKKKTAEKIADELLNQYQQSAIFLHKNQRYYRQVYSLPEAMKDVLHGLKPRHIKFDAEYTRYVSVTEKLIYGKILDQQHIASLLRHQDVIHQRIAEINGQNEDLKFELSNAIHFKGARYVKKLIEKCSRGRAH